MFTTFNAQSDKEWQRKPAAVATSTTQTTPRPKRSQIARACDSCRLNRIKCDNDHPCRNCKDRGVECTSNGRGEPRSGTQLTREVERLRARVKELEEQLEKSQSQHQDNPGGLPTPASSSAFTPSNLDPIEEEGGRRQLEGAWTANEQTRHGQLHGPSSSYYFISRLSSFLGLALQQPNYEQHMQPNAASRVFASPTTPRYERSEDPMTSAEILPTGEFLSRAQEDYFLSLFWQTYHCILPILDEREFRETYESLWAATPPGRCRQPSPVVDIILALCMQYGMAFVPRNDSNRFVKGRLDSNDSSIAGRGYYRRCRTMLASEQERPSIATLQCYVYSAVYLRNASFLNTAHNTLAVAVRTAYILGLHRKPSDDLPRAQQELHRRLWWAVHTLETKTCIALGRPWLADLSQVTCRLPADDQDLLPLAGVNFASARDDITWLSFQVQSTKMILAARAVHTAFADKCVDILGSGDGKSIYSNAQSFEDLANFLPQKLQYLRTWVHNVPDGLKTERRGGGSVFSTDRSALEIDPVAPPWLQRQRIMLELSYHDQIMNLYRPFIRFSSTQQSATPFADGHAISCLNHAMAVTNIIYQVLAETNILSGWHEAYKLQWNAALSIIGFSFGYPVCPPTPSARKAINTVIEVFEILGDNFAVAASAADVTRDLASKVDILIDRFRPRSSSASSQISLSVPTPQQSSMLAFNSNGVDPIGNASGSDEMEIVPQTSAGDHIAMGVSNLPTEPGFQISMDSFNAFEMLSTDGNGMSAGNWADFVGSD